MKTNLVLALIATCSVLTACGGFKSSVGDSVLNPIPHKPTQTELKIAQLDGVSFDKIQDKDKLPSINSLSIKLSGKQAPFQYEILVTPKDQEQRHSTGEVVLLPGDKSQFSIVSSSINVTLNADGNCVSVEVPNQTESVLFYDIETLAAPIVLCK